MNEAPLSSGEYQCLVENAPVMIWKSNAEGACDYFNTTWLNFRGRTLQEELGYGWAEGVYPEDLPRCLTTYQEAIRLKRPFQMEYRLRRHDGVYRWICDRAVPFQDAVSRFAGHIGSCIDITERVETRLRESEEHRPPLPVCAGCYKVRDAQDKWWRLEEYLEQYLKIQTTHGLCPDCGREYFPDWLA